MPSAWTTSGIDWGNLRKSRTEYIIYHLHKATYERYYNYYLSTRARWQISSIISGAPSPPSLKNFRVRTEVAIREIRSILNRIYSMDDSYLFSDNNGLTSYYLATRCMFKKDYTTTIKPSFNYVGAEDPTDPRSGNTNSTRFASNLGGLEPLDISQGGDLEDIAGGDLEFIRDLTMNRRVELDDLYKIYNILSTPQDCLCDTTRKDNVNNNPSYVMSAVNGLLGGFMGDFGDVDLGYAKNTSNNIGIPSNINNTINEFYTSQSEDPNGSIGGNRWGYIRYQHYLSPVWTSLVRQEQNNSPLSTYLKQRVDLGLIDIDDIKVNYFTTAYPIEPSPSESEFYTSYDEYPLSAFGGDGTWIKRTQSFSQDNFGNYYGMVGTNKLTSGLPTLPVDLVRRKEIVAEAHIRAMNIDSIKGLIEYYNEEAN